MFCFQSNNFVCPQKNLFIFQFFLFPSEDFYIISNIIAFLYNLFIFDSFSSFFIFAFSFCNKIRHDKLLPVTESIHLKHGIYRTGEAMSNLPGHPVLTERETLDQIVKHYFKKGLYLS